MNFLAAGAAFFLLCSSIDPVVSIKCYNCLSGTTPDCTSTDKAVLKKYEIDCDVLNSQAGSVMLGSLGLGKTFDRCQKGIKDGETARSCFLRVPNVPDNDCMSKDGVTVCNCSTDFCNAAPADQSTFMGIFCRLFSAGVLIILAL